MLLFSDGFDKYSAAADLAIRWNLLNTPSWSAAGGINGGGAVHMVGSSDSIACAFKTPAALDADSRIHAAWWAKVTAWPPTASAFGRFVTNQHTAASTFSGSGLYVNADGSLSVLEHSTSGTVEASSAAGVIVLDQYHHIEIKANFRDSGGVWQVWVDGIEVIDFTGDNNSGTQPTSCTGFKFNANSAIVQYFVDDLICWDESGTDFAHAQLPVLHQIETLSPTSDAAVDFTPSAGSNFENVDDALFHDGDATYNTSAVIGDVDMFGFANQAAEPNQTLAIALHVRGRKTDIGGVVGRTRFDPGTTPVESTDWVLATSVTHRDEYFGQNPDTTAAWGTTDVDSVEAGYEYQS